MSDDLPNANLDQNIQLGPLRIENFAELMTDLKTAVTRFQEESSPQNFAMIVTSLQGFGLNGADVWQQAAAYARKNPLRTAALAGLAFFAFKGLLVQSAKPSRKLIH